MDKNETFVKLNRGILDWEWYKDTNTKAMFIHLILKANIKPGAFRGVSIQRGELATSLASLSAETGLTIREVRTALDHLKSTGEATIQRHGNFSVISIVHYDLYQSNRQTNDTEATNQRQTSDKPSTTIKEYKNGNNKRKQDLLLSDKHAYGHLMLTDDEYSELDAMCKEPGQMVAYVDKVSNWLSVNKVDPIKHFNVFKKFLTNDGII